MSHEVESCFSVREVPWHGLGTIVQEQLTSADAIKAAGLDWRVDSRPIYTDIPGGQKMEIAGQRANVRDTDNKVLGLVSDRYKIVQNSEAFDFTDSLIGEGCRYETAGALFGGKKIWLLASLPEQKILDDEVIPYVCFTNAHDGFGAIKACCCTVRVVCNNTLNLALSTAPRVWSCKHIGNLSSKIDEAKRALEFAESYNKELAEFAMRAANTTITEEKQNQILSELFPVADDASDRTKRNVQDAVNDFKSCIVAVDLSPFYGTAWGLINAASDYVYHKPASRFSPTFEEKRMDTAIVGSPFLDKVAQLCGVSA